MIAEIQRAVAVRDKAHLEALWDELRAAVIVSWRVDTPEVKAEVRRATDALVRALDSS